MMQNARYAIYYAPHPDTPLWRFGSRVLGYDAASNLDIQGFSLPTVTTEAWRELTKRPRHYGFHGTLKAPFWLKDADEPALRLALSEFCANRPAFRLGPLTVAAIQSGGHGFVALIPIGTSPNLVRLEKDVITGFDHFRRPLSKEEYLKRKPETLTVRQRGHLEDYGYPFVLEDFRYHMTLTGECADAAQIADLLADEMANTISTADVQIDALCLFRQSSPDSPFTIIERFKMGA